MRKMFFFFFVLSFQTLIAQQTWEKSADSLLTKRFPASGPGATVIVTQKGKTIYHKAFGMADLENKVAMKPEMVFRIGSVTKQFTAVAILKLMEEGKLTLQDKLTQYIPDYPNEGNQVTLEHLLTHTSGIPSYTDMPVFDEAFMRKDMTPLELIDVFKKEPFDFKPGEKWHYNNSAYILLGYIIEKVTGQSYGDYIEKNIFKPLGMKTSLYGSNSKIIPNRAQGYGQAAIGYQIDPYLSMTLPYAAGSLMSTVEDLSKWSSGLMAGKIIKKENLEKAWTSYKLTNGKDYNYGYGWGTGEIMGKKLVEHSGGINGYLSHALYVPDEDLFVSVLSNCTCNSPSEANQMIAALVLGFNLSKTKIPTDSLSLREYAGVYEEIDGESETLREITISGNQLYSQRLGSNKLKLFKYEKDKFFFENSNTEMWFIRDKKGKVVGMNMKNLTTPAQYSARTTKPFAIVKKEIQVDDALLAKYVGEYKVSAQFGFQVTHEPGKLFVQATGQQKFQLFAETETKFFLKVIDAQIEFITKNNGDISHLVLYQNGTNLKGEKIK